ncbi:MAG: membrane protein insertion efficiency factor YidD [Simkaniaceae bacterium]|nr:membrane protein insertion efficiency factor YidD [Simkaniaceae bacterium]
MSRSLMCAGAVFFIGLYRRTVGSLVGSCCRFYPSCSEYALGAFTKYGFAKALLLTGKRLLKCHPRNPGGVDFP